jgi:hypothetical protein
MRWPHTPIKLLGAGAYFEMDEHLREGSSWRVDCTRGFFHSHPMAAWPKPPKALLFRVSLFKFYSSAWILLCGSYDFLCISWISYDILLRFLTYFLDFLWYPMISYDFLWFLMISYGFPMDFLWISYDFLRFPMISYDFLWFPMDFPWFHTISYVFPSFKRLAQSFKRSSRVCIVRFRVFWYT